MPSRALPCLLVTIALFAPSHGVAQSDWTTPMEPFAIGEGLYYVGTAGLAAYLFTSEEGHVLIDAPLDENVEMVLGNIRLLGFDPRDVRLLLASHAHFDHVGGMARIREATGAQLVLSARDAEYVGRGRDFGLEGLAGYPPAAADRVVGHHETVRMGPWALTAHLTPGHTPGCTTWSGDVVIEGAARRFISVCSLSVLGSYQLVGEGATYPGQGRDYCTSVAHLRSLSPEVFLAPHGSFYGLAEKLRASASGDRLAFVERERYARYLDDAQRSIERRLAEQGWTGGCASLIEGDR